MRTAYGSVVGLADDDPLVVELEARTARLNAIAPAQDSGQTSTAIPSVRCGAASPASGSVLYAGPTTTTSSAPSSASPGVVPGVAHRREPVEIARRADAAGLRDRDDVVAVVRPGVQRDVVAVLGEVERRRDSPVPRSEHCHPHA